MVIMISNKEAYEAYHLRAKVWRLAVRRDETSYGSTNNGS